MYTQQQFDALTEAIASGALTVTYADRTVTYRSLSDMMRIREDMRKQLAPSAAKASAYRVKMEFDKGL